MKVGLLSDIHGNVFALDAVLDVFKREGVENLLCAGDFVGYYPFVNEVMDRLRAANVIAVAGNHDRFLLDSSALTGEKRQAYRLDETIQTLRVDHRDWLERLPVLQEIRIDGLTIILCHGSPWALDEYIYPDFHQWERFLELSADIVVFGHTHIPIEKRVGATTIINPGSCGQPRDYQPGACCAILDTSTCQVKFYRQQYDVGNLVDYLERQSFPPSLVHILNRQK